MLNLFDNNDFLNKKQENQFLYFNNVLKNTNTQKKIPTKIQDTYKDDYDINYIHEIILSKLLQEKDNLQNLYTELNNLKLLESKPQTYNLKKETLQSIHELEKEINLIKTGNKLKTYHEEVDELIIEYLNLKKKQELNENELNKRLYIIDKYLKIAKKYIQINITRIITKEINCCLNCKTSLDGITSTNEGIIRCINCHNEHKIVNFVKTIQINDNENDIENFIKALMRYQGLQNNPPTILYTKLDNYFKERELPISKEIKSLPYNEYGKKGNTNKEMLFIALSNIGYSSYYEDINLIGHIYWDWKLPNLTHLKDKILRHYTITQKSFYKIPIEIRCRISSLGTQYRLWRHLELVGHPCYMNEFKIAENNDSLQNHHRIWKMMCELSNDPEIYYIE